MLGPLVNLEAGVVGVSAQGLELSAAGATRVVPFQAIGAVHAGLVPSGAGRALIVELIMRQPGRVVRLSGSDPRVPALFPGLGRSREMDRVCSPEMTRLARREAPRS